MSDTGIGLFLVATGLMSLSPGPNVLMLLSLGLRDGKTAVLKAVAGIAAASLIFLLVSALGLVAALTASVWLFRAVTLAGAGYLVYLGVRLVLGSGRAMVVSDLQGRPLPRPFLQGFVTHLANPKAMLYWSALLPQFLDTGRALAPQVVGMGLAGIALDVVILTAYGLSAAAARRNAVSPRFQRLSCLAGGVFFVCAGVLLALAQFRKALA